MVDVEYIGEFGVELSTAIPYCYYLHSKGCLGKTKSVKGTHELYYFSPKHKIKDTSRRPNDRVPDECLSKNHKKKKTWRHGERNYSSWIPPPYKEHFQNDVFVYDKPLLIIYNKFSNEWGPRQHNYIDLITLEKLIEHFRYDYKIIYIRPIGNEKDFVNDSQKIPKFKDMNVMSRLQITTIQDLANEHKDLNFNQLQMKILANCERFISVQGGGSVLASYFKGINIIFHKVGHELENGAYTGYFPKLSGASIIVVSNYNELIQKAKESFKTKLENKEKYLKENPIPVHKPNTQALSKFKDHLDRCIEKSNKSDSKITDHVKSIQGMTSTKFRHLINNICSMDDCRQLEIGSWKGSTTCASLCGNKMKHFVTIDNFSQFNHKPKWGFNAQNDMLTNVESVKGENHFEHKCIDCWRIKKHKLPQFNVFLYDGEHSYNSNKRSIAHFMSNLDDEFIFISNCWNWEHVRNGINDCIDEHDLEVLYKHEEITKDVNWREPDYVGHGTCVMVLKKG